MPAPASTAARSASPTSGRSGPFRRRTEASELRQTTRQSPSARAAASARTWPACRRSKQPPVATTVPPASRTRRASVRASSGRAGAGRAPAAQAAAPPASTKAEAAATAAGTASDGSAPAASRPAAVALKQSPAPHGSPAPTRGAGTASAGPSACTSSAPRSPSVTHTATAPQRRAQRAAARLVRGKAARRRRAAPGRGLGRRAGARDRGAARPGPRVGHRGAGLRGVRRHQRAAPHRLGPPAWGSQTIGTPPTAASAARTEGSAATPRP